MSASTDEDGGETTVSIALSAAPTSNVTLHLVSSDTTEGVLDQGSIIFTPENWRSPQTVTVTGADDTLADGPMEYEIAVASIETSDAAFTGLQVVPLTITNLDNESPAFTISTMSGSTNENGGTAKFDVRLNCQPLADVVLGLTSSRTNEGVLDHGSLTFTPENWLSPQTVVLTGVDDAIDDGDVTYQVAFAPSASSDPGFAMLQPEPLDVVNVDNESANLVVTAVSGDTTEAGGQATFTVALGAQPLSNVTLQLDSTDSTEGMLANGSLSFTRDNWMSPQTVTVTGVNDDLADGAVPYAIHFAPIASLDAAYAQLAPADVVLRNVDDESANIIVTPVAGSTTEAGGRATFTLALSSQPSADVTINFASSDPTEGILDRNAVTFTTLNWQAPQTVTLTGVDDLLADGGVPYAVIFSAPSSLDAAYAALRPTALGAVNVDNETPGVRVLPTSGSTRENGGQATFALTLNSQPTAAVTLNFSSSDVTEGTLDRTTLTFTPENWGSPQIVNVTGVNDALADGNVPYSITFGPIVSTDAGYAAVTVPVVPLTNIDDDSAGFSVTPVSGTTSETGIQATFALVLNSQPTADVVVNMNTNDASEGSLNVGSLTFTAANWASPQIISVTGVDDAIADGNVPYAIAFGLTASADPKYAVIRPNNVTLVNVDNDTPGFSVSALTGTPTEAGGQATFSVALNSQPSANVTVSLASSDTGEGVVSAPSLTFTPDNYAAPQVVTVTGVNDALVDGTAPFSVTFGATTSADAAYAAIRPASVALSNVDNDSAGITVSPIAGSTNEGGGQATFSIALNSEPSSNVVVRFDSNNHAEANVDNTALTFTPASWNVPQIVTLTGVDDAVADGNANYSVVFASTLAADAGYAGLVPANLVGTNTDNDTAGITVSALSGSTNEAGAQATFRVVLNSQPTADVTLGMTSNNTNEGTVTPLGVTFTTTNWNVPRTVTLTGVDDDIADGNVPYAIVFAASTSSDARYSGLVPANVVVVNADNDTAGISVSRVSNNLSESGRTATFSVVLNTRPTATVTVNFDSTDTTEGTLSTDVLTFTTANWNVPQIVTATGVDDAIVDADIGFAVRFEPTASLDAQYAALRPADVPLINADNDPGIVASAISGTTSEAGGQATFTVLLDRKPATNVTLIVSSDNENEGTASGSALTFTPNNWNVAQVVTVTGVDDAQDDGDVAFGVIVGRAVGSSLGQHTAVVPVVVSVTNVDND